MLIVGCFAKQHGKSTRKVVSDTHLLQANRDGFALGRLLLGDAPPQVDVREENSSVLTKLVNLQTTYTTMIALTCASIV